MPGLYAIDRTGAGITDAEMRRLLLVDPAEWAEAVTAQGQFFEQFGARLPAELKHEHERLVKRVEDAITPADLRDRDLT